jgi:hypothetical protein
LQQKVCDSGHDYAILAAIKGIGNDIKKRTINLYENGVHVLSTTKVKMITTTIASTFKSPEAVRNRTIVVHDIMLTHARLLEMTKNYNPRSQWMVKNLSSEERMKGKSSFDVLGATIFSGKFQTTCKHLNDELLGLGFMREDEVERAIIDELARIWIIHRPSYKHISLASIA